MSVSLNAEKHEIAYDTRIDYYIDLYKFAGELVLSFKLPCLLPSLNECYCVETCENSFAYQTLKGVRRVVIAGTRNWISNNRTGKVLDYPTGTVVFFTSLVIAVEIKKSEIPESIKLFWSESSRLNAIAEGILQNALEIALFRYNEKTNGASFLTPSIIDCDRVDLGLYINYLEKRLHRYHFIKFRYPIIGANETPIDKKSFSEEIHNWR